jgi:hypothetical protein
MYGSFSFTTFVAVVAAVALVVALSFLASPLIAVIIVIPVGLVGLVFMSGQRQRSEEEDRERGPALTPEGKPTSPTGSGSSGAPASGEGEV